MNVYSLNCTNKYSTRWIPSHCFAHANISQFLKMQFHYIIRRWSAFFLAKAIFKPKYWRKCSYGASFESHAISWESFEMKISSWESRPSHGATIRVLTKFQFNATFECLICRIFWPTFGYCALCNAGPIVLFSHFLHEKCRKRRKIKAKNVLFGLHLNAGQGCYTH